MPPSLCVKVLLSPDEDAVLLSVLAELFVVDGVLAGELEALVLLLLLVLVELVVVSDLEHPTKSAAARPSAKISFNVFTNFLL